MDALDHVLDRISLSVSATSATFEGTVTCTYPALRQISGRRWLTTYDDLFTRPCQASGLLLAADAAGGHFFPPLLRSMGHQNSQNGKLRSCLIAAVRGGNRAAYHPHAVSRDTLLAVQL